MRISDCNFVGVCGECVTPTISGKSFQDFSARIIMGPPAWYPGSSRLNSDHGIPTLPFVSDANLPLSTLAFDKIARSGASPEQLINFYVSDTKLRTLLYRPDKFLIPFSGAWGVTSPDISIWRESPMFARVGATWYNRAIGCYFSDRGIRVIPQIRWSSTADYSHCFAGVIPGSVVAVSNNGCWRDVVLRQSFLHGLGELRDRLSPSTVIVYGRIDDRIRSLLGSQSRILHFESHQTKVLAAV